MVLQLVDYQLIIVLLYIRHASRPQPHVQIVAVSLLLPWHSHLGWGSIINCEIPF